MTVTILNSPITTKILPPAETSLFLRALNWLAECDRRYRETVKLQSLPPERLIDMGIIR